MCLFLFSQGFAEQYLEPELEHGTNLSKSHSTYNDAKDSIVADEKVNFDFFSNYQSTNCLSYF